MTAGAPAARRSRRPTAARRARLYFPAAFRSGDLRSACCSYRRTAYCAVAAELRGQPTDRSSLLTPFTPQLQLETLFVLDDEGRIVSTREPDAAAGPAFSLIRDRHSCAWAVHRDVPAHLARDVVALARTEPPAREVTDPPTHANAYVALLGGRIESGPAFTFPASVSATSGVVAITDLAQLERHFRGWTSDELPERSPILGIVEDGHAVSVCFCARRSPVAAEAGLETAPNFRGRGFGARVAAAWARAVWDSGRLPLFSTSWSNAASLAVARKLELCVRASDWNLYS
jgi:hypothetical protein